jgi:hypothetical protein
MADGEAAGGVWQFISDGAIRECAWYSMGWAERERIMGVSSGVSSRYLISFAQEARDGMALVIGLCIVDAANAGAALATARTVCQQRGAARVVRIPAHVVIDPADLNRRIPREEMAALCERLELQLPHHTGHGQSSHP